MSAATRSAACNASLAVAIHSGCPSSQWQDAIAPLLVKRLPQGANLTFVNVGANKGYNVAEFMQRYAMDRSQRQSASQPRLTSMAWHTQLKLTPGSKPGSRPLRVRYGCGLCNACRSRPPRARFAVPVDVHAVEMVRLNAHALRGLFAAFGVPGRVHHLAMSNYTGRASYRAGASVGLEHYELGKAGNFQREWVACTTLDAFAAQHLAPAAAPAAAAAAAAAAATAAAAAPTPSASAAAGPRIDLLSIDVEGQDALVLEGAVGLLRRQLVGVLEFEFIGRGFWRADHGADQRLLRAVLASLDGYGYRCFWQGKSGKLGRASGPHWCDAFQFRLRSNLVCSHVPEVLRAFEAMSV